MRVLLVEDDGSAAQFISKGLREASYAVDVARDGARASALCTDNEYDAIVLDVMLPKKDGLTVCRELRAAGRAVAHPDADGARCRRGARGKPGRRRGRVPHQAVRLSRVARSPARTDAARPQACPAGADIGRPSHPRRVGAAHLVARRRGHAHIPRIRVCSPSSCAGPARWLVVRTSPSTSGTRGPSRSRTWSMSTCSACAESSILPARSPASGHAEARGISCWARIL